GRPLLGFHGPAVPFWERSRDHPSVALIEPEGPALVVRRGPSVWCRLRWRGRVVQLPCLDRRVGRALADSGRTWVEMGRTDRLVVALTPPMDGHCHKVVAGVLPRPGWRVF
ncbi:MAG TPA: hypothetical protein VLL25_08640, partial [Acidimicrobiales bacterium]|nr:hypothetical protein [Acidimicrobiales bacterium]